METEILENVVHVPPFIMFDTEPLEIEKTKCQFCSRIGEWIITTQLNGQGKEYWVCGRCPLSIHLMSKWRIQ
ncbi:hypothetical protein MTBBW1_2400035 [Desulfamplus magnetovallimortis]|uniref:Uncharacterized protein n=1 Tax=Desulfamplus magnetovallimortis TaxID=1246637 RepID=A0A1W1HE56_9BACT|nr:hypothetical protein [Desulfamplus magnetovallimortis]SLM30781.1 hypothetical protein MTBBW1_2400035 [Desulfamplus magnetovallimortis]